MALRDEFLVVSGLPPLLLSFPVSLVCGVPVPRRISAARPSPSLAVVPPDDAPSPSVSPIREPAPPPEPFDVPSLALYPYPSPSCVPCHVCGLVHHHDPYDELRYRDRVQAVSKTSE